MVVKPNPISIRFLGLALLCLHLVNGLPAQSVEPQNARVYLNRVYVADGHDRQKLDLYLPPTTGTVPLIIYIHGGAWLGGSKGNPPGMEFVKQGFALASINYRLSQHATYPAQIEDCKAAVRWLRAHAGEYGLDPVRFVAWGHSAGGHLAALLGTAGGVKEFDVGEYLEHSSAVQGVIDEFGPTDFMKMDEQRLPEGMRHGGANTPEGRLVGGEIEEKKDLIAKANPITYVTPDDPPFVIIHGERDPLVPYLQSVILAEALEKAGVDHQLYIVEGAGHGGYRDPKVDELRSKFLGRFNNLETTTDQPESIK